jgi:hypothetical protein
MLIDPALIVTFPVNVLTPLNVNVPEPTFTILPLPDRIPEYDVLKLFVFPTVSATAAPEAFASDRAPPPARPPSV